MKSFWLAAWCVLLPLSLWAQNNVVGAPPATPLLDNLSSPQNTPTGSPAYDNVVGAAPDTSLLNDLQQFMTDMFLADTAYTNLVEDHKIIQGFLDHHKDGLADGPISEIRSTRLYLKNKANALKLIDDTTQKEAMFFDAQQYYYAHEPLVNKAFDELNEPISNSISVTRTELVPSLLSGASMGFQPVTYPVTPRLQNMRGHAQNAASNFRIVEQKHASMSGNGIKKYEDIKPIHEAYMAQISAYFNLDDHDAFKAYWQQLETEMQAQLTQAQLTSNTALDENFLFPTWNAKEGTQGADDHNAQSREGGITGVWGQNNDNVFFAQVFPRGVKLLFQLTAPVIMLSLIYIGSLMVMANGNEEQITRGKTYFQYLIIGVVIMLMAYSIISVLINLIGQ